MIKKERKVIDKKIEGETYRVISFLEDNSDALTITPSPQLGISAYRIYKVSTAILNDFIIAWSSDRKHKVIYRIRSSCRRGNFSTGLLEDLVALDKVDSLTEKAILTADKEARKIGADTLIKIGQKKAKVVLAAQAEPIFSEEEWSDGIENFGGAAEDVDDVSTGHLNDFDGQDGNYFL